MSAIRGSSAKQFGAPFLGLRLPIVADDHVDFEFGTGVLKVTPAHDKADYEIGQRHNLPAIDVLNPDGTMNELAGEEFAGLDRFEARKIAAAKLAEMGLLVKEEDYMNKVGFSERADVPIEPRLSLQWFLIPIRPRSQTGGARWRDHIWPERWTKNLPPLAGKYSGLVHLPAVVVGPPHSGMVSEQG